MATLALNARLVRPAVGSIVSPKDAGEATAIGRLVYVETNGKVYETDATNANTVTGQLGMVVGTGQPHRTTGIIAADERVDVLWFGRVQLGVTLNPDAQYYAANVASTVKGLIGDVAGSTSRRIGKAESADGTFFFNPQDVATVS